MGERTGRAAAFRSVFALDIVASCMAVLLAHLLKWRHQSGRCGASWERTIREQRRAIHIALWETSSLKQSLENTDWRMVAWGDAVAKAIEDSKGMAETALGADDMESCEGWMRQIEFCGSAKRMMTLWANVDYWAESSISV